MRQCRTTAQVAISAVMFPRLYAAIADSWYNYRREIFIEKRALDCFTMPALILHAELLYLLYRT